ncbi:MAG: helix-turn-helix domain-containing protein [Actinobacteria bacterium]|nr:helix-turn-helix domain-containing protein [Actinomycetota bacterium]
MPALPANAGHEEGERMLLSVPEVARALRIGRRQAWEMVWQDKLPVVRLGPRTIRVCRAELERYVQELSRPYGA